MTGEEGVPEVVGEVVVTGEAGAAEAADAPSFADGDVFHEKGGPSWAGAAPIPGVGPNRASSASMAPAPEMPEAPIAPLPA